MGKMDRNTKGSEQDELRRVEDAILPAEQVKLHFENALKEQKRRERRQQFDRWINRGTIISLSLAVFGAAGALYTILPLKEFVPVFITIRADGTPVSTVQWADLPQEVRSNAVVNTAWTYVMDRESWSVANSGWAYQVVSAMSSPLVRDQFQAWYDPSNPKSPARMYKDGTTVSIDYKHWEPLCPQAGCASSEPEGYRFWFDRIETPPDAPPKPPVRFSATVRVQVNVPLPQDRMWQRWTFNAPQIQVTEYPGPRREGVAQ
jgi:type IV secretory pathway component VirB8